MTIQIQCAEMELMKHIKHSENWRGQLSFSSSTPLLQQPMCIIKVFRVGYIHCRLLFNAKFHYASWLRAGSKLVRSCSELKFGLSSSLYSSELTRASRFTTKFHYASWFKADSELIRGWFEPDSVMEFGFYREIQAYRMMQKHGVCELKRFRIFHKVVQHHV